MTDLQTDKTDKTDRLRDDHGRGNALAWFVSIVEMVDKLRAAEAAESDEVQANYDEDRPLYLAREEAERAIHESVLSVEVRSGWYAYPSGPRDESDRAPAEFRILLTTGGPAAQLVGELSDSGEPETARLEFQDWGTPWTEVRFVDLCALADKSVPAGSVGGDAIETVKAYLLDFAREFYFGEG